MKSKFKKMLAVLLAVCTLCSVSISSNADSRMYVTGGTTTFVSSGAGQYHYTGRINQVNFSGYSDGYWVPGRNVQLTPYSSASTGSKIGPTLVYTSVGAHTDFYYNQSAYYSRVYCGGYCSSTVNFYYTFSA